MKTNIESYNITLANTMLRELERPIKFVKYITGLSYKKMVNLGLIEWYHPFTKKVWNEELKKVIEVPDTTINWLRVKV